MQLVDLLTRFGGIWHKIAKPLNRNKPAGLRVGLLLSVNAVISAVGNWPICCQQFRGWHWRDQSDSSNR